MTRRKGTVGSRADIGCLSLETWLGWAEVCVEPTHGETEKGNSKKRCVMQRSYQNAGGVNLTNVLSSFALVLCLSCSQSSRRAERHMSKYLSRRTLVRKSGSKDEGNLNSVPWE